MLLTVPPVEVLAGTNPLPRGREAPMKVSYTKKEVRTRKEISYVGVQLDKKLEEGLELILRKFVVRPMHLWGR